MVAMVAGSGRYHLSSISMQPTVFMSVGGAFELKFCLRAKCVLSEHFFKLRTDVGVVYLFVRN